mmetsp:Transcript_9585/g.14156  ORF Transcript_9585/g.14156 Transcript_9585/m.14156 type:complete len:219 (+) Transcript_9585:2022-2678(+)
MKSILLIAVVLMALVAVLMAQKPVPNFPPQVPYQMKVTYNPAIYYDTPSDMSGNVYSDGKKYAIDTQDPVRTFEKIFLEADNLYVYSKFGEFGWDCIEWKNSSLTGLPSTFPTLELSQDYFQKNAVFNTTKDGVDYFTLTVSSQAGKTTSYLAFEGDNLKGIETQLTKPNGDNFTRMMTVQGIELNANIDPSVFDRSSLGAQCNPPSMIKAMKMRKLH